MKPNGVLLSYQQSLPLLFSASVLQPFWPTMVLPVLVLRFGARHLEVLYLVGDQVHERVKLHIEDMNARVESDRRTG